MKSNLNNIDEIFREGLNNFAQEPESGLWKKIAGKLLWREIMHFNFTNIPAVWSGVAATGIITVSLLVFNLLPSENDQQTNTPITESFSPDQNTQAFVQNEPVKESVDNTNSVLAEKIPQKIAETEKSPTIGISKQTTQPGQADNHGFEDLQNTEETPVSDAKPTDSYEEIASLKPENPLPGEALIPVQAASNQAEMNPEKSTSGSDFQEKQTQNTADSEINPSAVDLTDNELPVTQSVIAESKVDEISESQPNGSSFSSTPEINKIKPVGNEQTEIVDSQKQGVPNPTERNTTGHEVHLITPLPELKSNSTGKIQNINSRSNSVVAFFKGKYKPPKRDFDEGAMELYRGKTKYWSISAYGSYEETNYTRTISSSSEKTWLGGASAGYHNGRYLLQGGVELSYMNDVGDYMVDMSTYDSVGFYYGVGEFIVDPENPDSVIFVIQKITVYDSVQHQSNHQNHCSFTYLQIPLMIGYKAFQQGRFSAYLKAGPSISLMLTKKVPAFSYINPEATVHSINNYSMPRITTSVQVLMSVDLRYQLTKNLGILVEPTYRYYLRGVYDISGNNLKKPYSMGIRGGVYYNFW